MLLTDTQPDCKPKDMFVQQVRVPRSNPQTTARNYDLERLVERFLLFRDGLFSTYCEFVMLVMSPVVEAEAI